jgi:hypothetical protein
MPEVTSEALTAALYAENTQLNPTTNLPEKEVSSNDLTRSLYSTVTGSETKYRDVPKSYERILGQGEYHPEFGTEYNNNLLAERQSGARQLGSAVNQAVVGELVGGTIEGIGYSWDFKQIYDIIAGNEQEWGNAFSDFGKDVRTWTQEKTPVYVREGSPKFAPTRGEWWAANAPSILSTLSLLIPAGAAAKGAQGASQAFINLTKKSPKFIKRLAAGETAIVQAVTSRHLENLMEASGVYDEMIAKGYDKENASIAAANTYKKQWILLLQDIPQYMLFNKMLGKSLGKGVNNLEKSKSVSAFMGYNPNKVFVNKTVSALKTSVGEAGEEAYQFLVNEQSKVLAENAHDPAMKYSVLDALKENYDNGELYTSMWFGALGAGAMLGTGAALNRKQETKADEARLNDIKNVGTEYNQGYQTFLDAQERNDPMDQESAWNNVVAKIGISAAVNGNSKHAINIIKESANPDNNTAWEQFGVDDQAGGFLQQNPEKAEEIQAGIERIGQLYDRFSRENKLNDKIAKNKKESASQVMALTKFMIDSTKEQLNTSNQRLNESKEGIEEFLTMTPTGQEIENLKYTRNALNDSISYFNKRINNEKVGAKEKAEFTMLKAEKELAKEQVNTEIAKANKTYTEEQRTKDDEIKATFDSEQVDRHISEIKRNEFIKASISKLEAEQKHYRSGEDLASSDEKSEHTEAKEADAFDTDAHVNIDDTVSFSDAAGLKRFAKVDSIQMVDKDTEGNEINKSGDNADNTYNIEILNEDGTPSGELTTVTLRQITLENKRTYVQDPDSSVDPLSSNEEAITGVYNAREANESRGSSNPISNLSYTNVLESDSKLVEIRNDKLNKVISNPKTNYNNSTAEYYLDLKDEFTKKQFAKFKKRGGKLAEAITKLQNNKPITASDIDALTKSTSGQDFNDFVDQIKVSVRVKIGKAVYSNGLALHASGFNYIKIPIGVQVKERKAPGAIESYKLDKKIDARKARVLLLKEILKGKTPVSRSLSVGRGAPLSTPGAKNNVATVLKTNPNDVKLGVVKSSASQNYVGELHTGENDTHKGVNYSNPGAIHAITDKTINGDTYALKLNRAKLDPERASILFEAFRILGMTSLPRGDQGFTKGGRYFAQFQNPLEGNEKVVEGLSVGQLIDLLVISGQELTDPNNPKFKTRVRNNRHAQVLANKRLYLDIDRVQLKPFLVYGNNPVTNEGYRIDLSKQGAELNPDIDSFVRWATEHKNYANHIVRHSLQLELNNDFLNGKEFRIGINEPMSRKKSENYNAFLINNSIVTTDAQVDKDTGLAFHAPTLDLRLYDSNGDLTYDTSQRKSVMPPPKATPKPAEPEQVKVEATKEVEKNYQPGSSPINESSAKELEESGILIIHARNSEEYDEMILDGWEPTGDTSENGEPELMKNVKKEPKGKKATEEKDIEAPADLPSLDQLMDDFQGDTDTFFTREYKKGKFKVQNLSKELQWVADKVNITNDEVKIRKLGELVRDGKDNFALFSKDGIELYEAAEEGTLYHEAFHRVSLGYLTDIERKGLYRSAKAFYKMPNATDREIEETLAEGFREYVINRQQDKPTSILSKIGKFFKDLYDFIEAFFVGNNKLTSFEVDSVFKDIYKGRYRNSKMTKDNIARLGNDEYSKRIGDREFNTIDTRKQINSLVKSLANRLIMDNGVTDLNDVKDIQWKPLYDSVEKLVKYQEMISNNEELTDEQRSTASRQHDMYSEVLADMELENQPGDRSVFIDRIRSYLLTYGIVNRYQEIKPDGNPNDDEKVVGSFDLDKRSSWETSTKDNAMASIKFLVSMLYENNSKDVVTGLRDYVDFNETWHMLLERLHQYDTIEDMIDELNEYGAEVDNGFPFIQLAHKLETYSEETRNQFLTTFRNHRYDFINFMFKNTSSDGSRIEIINTGSDEVYRNTTKSWNEMFYYDANIVNTDKYGNKTLSLEFFNKLSNKYIDLKDFTAIARDANDYSYDTELEIVNGMIDIFADIHVDIDQATVNDFIQGKKGDAAIDKMFNAVVDMASVFDGDLLANAKIGEPLGNIPSMFLRNPVIIGLSKSYAKAHPEKRSDVVLGAKNNKYFSYSKNNMITDIVRKIKNKDGYVSNKIEKVYNRGSLILEQMLDPTAAQNFGVLTFSKLADKRGGDPGRDYVNITRLEDYLIKFAAITNGYLTMPILADRKQYHIIDGIEGYKDVITASVEDTGGKFSYTFSEEVLDRFYKYYLDEKDRINAATKLRKEYLAAKGQDQEILKRRLIKNYHYTGNFNVKSKKANAYGFIHFKGFSQSASPTDIKAKISGLLSNYVNDEIQYASQIDVIERRGNDLSVKTMDGSLIEASEVDLGTSEAIRRIFGDYTVGNMVSIMESEKVFFADPAFFKQNKETSDVTEDMYKRWFGPGSSGQNLAESTKSFPNETYNVVTLNTQEFKSEYYDALHDKQSELYERLLRKDPKKKDWTDAKFTIEADHLAKLALSAYEQVDSTDGQVFISPEMYKSIASRLGEWTKVKNDAYNMLISNKKLDAAEEIKASAAVLQPLKLVYIGKEDDNDLDTVVYDKMSMATIFPRQAAGTNLQSMSEAFMGIGVEEPIEAFKFDTAVKVGGRVGVDYFENGQTRDKANKMTDLPLYKQYYENLRFQVVTDTHDVTDQTVGTQMFKVAMMNIQKEIAYGDYEKGQELLDSITASRVAISDMGAEEVKTKFGYKNGLISDDKLIEMLRDDAEQAGKSDDFQQALKLDDDGKQYFQLDTFSDRRWVYSRIVSIINSYTVDLNMPGNQLIQVSDYGSSPLSTNDELAFIHSTVGDTDVYEMEARVSINLFKSMIPNDLITFAQKKKFIGDKLKVIGYRIPTQGQNSIVRLNIVDILPEQAGDVIQLPLEFTALTGSDFDIDKLFVISYNYKRGSTTPIPFLNGDDTIEERYKAKGGDKFMSKESFGKLSIENQNTKEANQNRIIDAFNTVLSSEDHFLETTTPLGRLTKILKNKSESYQKAAQGGKVVQLKALESLTPKFQSGTKFIFTGSKSGIGPFALSNAHHSLTQHANVGLNSELDFSLNDDGVIWFNKMRGDDGRLISDWISALIDAHVDAVKDPYIIKLNVNNATYDVTNFMIRAGVGENTFAFLSQPILKEYANEYFNASGKINDKAIQDIGAETAAFNKIKDRWLTDFGLDEDVIDEFKIGEHGINKIPLSTSLQKTTLGADISSKQAKDRDYVTRQVNILYHFRDILVDAKELTRLTMASRVDTKKYGATPTEIMNFINSIKAAENSERWVNLDKLIQSDGKQAEGGTMLSPLLKNSALLTLDMLSSKSMYGSTGFVKIFWEIVNSVPSGQYASVSTINNITEELYSYFAGQFFADNKDGMGMSDPRKLRTLLTGNTKSVFAELDKIKSGKSKYSNELKDNKLINALNIDSSQDAPFSSYLRMPFRTLNDKWETDDYIDDFNELFTHKDVAIRDLGRKLMMYSYYTSGFRNRFYSFHNYIPMESFKELDTLNKDGGRKKVSFDNYIKNLLQELNDPSMYTAHMEQAKKEVFLNNWQNNAIVPTVSSEGIFQTFEKDNESVGFIMDFGNNRKLILGVNPDKQIIYSPFVTMNYVGQTLLMEYSGLSKGNPVYRIVRKKGFQYKGVILKEYGVDSNKSVLDPLTKALEIKNRDDLAQLPEDQKRDPFNWIYTVNEDEFANIIRGDGNLFQAIPFNNQYVSGKAPVENTFGDDARGVSEEDRLKAFTQVDEEDDTTKNQCKNKTDQ